MTSGKSLCTSVSTADKSRWVCKYNPGFVLPAASGVSWMNWLSAHWSPFSRPPPAFPQPPLSSVLLPSPSWKHALSCLKPPPGWLWSTVVILHPTFELEYISLGFLKQQCPSLSLYQTSPFACKRSLLITILQTLKLLHLLQGCGPSWEALHSGRQVLTLPTPPHPQRSLTYPFCLSHCTSCLSPPAFHLPSPAST